MSLICYISKWILKISDICYKYINAFDYYYKGYPTTKYVNYLSSNTDLGYIENYIQLGIQDLSISSSNQNIRLITNTIFSSLFAYAQKIIYREKTNIEEYGSNIRADLNGFVHLIIGSLSTT